MRVSKLAMDSIGFLIIKKYWKFVILLTVLGLILAQVQNQYSMKSYKANALIYVGDLSAVNNQHRIPTIDPHLFSVKLLSDPSFTDEINRNCETNSLPASLNQKKNGVISIHKTSAPLFLEITVVTQSPEKTKKCIDYVTTSIIRFLAKRHDDYKQLMIRRKNIIDELLPMVRLNDNGTNRTIPEIRNHGELSILLEKNDIQSHITHLSYSEPFVVANQGMSIKKMGPSDIYVLFLGAVIGLGIGVGISIFHYRLRQFT